MKKITIAKKELKSTTDLTETLAHLNLQVGSEYVRTMGQYTIMGI